MNTETNTIMMAGSEPAGQNERVLNSEQIISLGCAIDDEIEAVGQAKTTPLHIDTIELIHMGQGGFIYRLGLSNPTHLQVDQPLTLTGGRSHGSEPIHASILRVADQQIDVFCQYTLPEDVRLLHAEFDPSFIFSALRDFIQAENCAPAGLAHQLARGVIPAARAEAKVRCIQGLNDEQLAGLRKMLTGPVHFLWGPPGTGKTWTVGAAVAEWVRNNKSVLILATSNTAVDIALKAAIRHTDAGTRAKFLRLGNTVDPELSDFTVAGKVTKDVGLALGGSGHVLCVQQRLKEVVGKLTRLLINHRQQNRMSESTGRELDCLVMEKARLEAELSQHNAMIDRHTQAILKESTVVACTLAKMVLEKKLPDRSFDVVVVDETSMVSLAYAVAASMLAKDVLVYAGDPYQLPPICRSDSSDARRWFGRNIYNPLGIEMESKTRTDAITLLKKQYRMTNQIGSFVSALTYHGRLEHARAQEGPQIEFIELPEEWCRTYYSVSDESYYHAGVIPLIRGILPRLGPDKEQVCLLTPFRAQQALMAATVRDLVASKEITVSCSTIHRAQGSEARAVIMDFTAHSPYSMPRFFAQEGCSNLLNVALSRAQNQLIVLGNRRLLDALADSGSAFWGRFCGLLRDHACVRSAQEILPEVQPFGNLPSMMRDDEATSDKKPAIVAIGDHPDAPHWGDLLGRVEASRKLLVLPKNGSMSGSFIVRHDAKGQCPSLCVARGYVFLPLNGGWVAVHSPRASRVIWRVGFSHLADGEVNPADEKTFFCERCFGGYLTVESDGDGWFLRCNRWPDCRHQRRLSLAEAKLKVRLNDKLCPKGHPLTARSGPSGLFIGCENWPSCDHRESLSILRGL